MLAGEWGLWGLGALMATHRGVDLDAMRAGLATGAMDALLFPQDPVGQAAQIVASLAAFFPAAPPQADKHVIGLLGKYTWPSGFASIAIGLIAEFSGSWKSWPTKIVVPFSIKVGKEGKLKSPLWIEIQGLGDYDAALDVLQLHATLRNSRFIGADLVGGLALFHGDPDEHDLDTTRGFFASIGGYHPSYFGGKGPQRASVDKRAGIVIQRGNAVKLEVSGYLAKSPAGIHFGVYGHLHVEALGFGLDGKFWLDALVHSLDSWTIGVGGSVALILFDHTITELSLEGEWTRTDKVRFAGSVTFKVLWWSVSKHTDKLLSDEIDSVEQAENAESQIVAALTEPTSYPNRTPGGVTLVRGERPGVWSAPEQPLTFVQKYVPLDMQIERINASPLARPTTFSIGPVSIGGHDRAKAPALSEFAPAAFLSLDTDAALHAPLAELWPAGFSVGDEVAVGHIEGATAKLDEITVDRKQHARRPRRVEVSDFVRAHLALAGVQPTAPPVRVRRPTYASRLGDAPATFGKAWAVRGTLMRRAEGIE